MFFFVTWFSYLKRIKAITVPTFSSDLIDNFISGPIIVMSCLQRERPRPIPYSFGLELLPKVMKSSPILSKTFLLIPFPLSLIMILKQPSNSSNLTKIIPFFTNLLAFEMKLMRSYLIRLGSLHIFMFIIRISKISWLLFSSSFSLKSPLTSSQIFFMSISFL